SRRRHTSFSRDWRSDVCSSDLLVFAWHVASAPNGLRHLLVSPAAKRDRSTVPSLRRATGARSMSFPLEFLYESELLSPLDYHFTRTLSELSGEKNPHALAALALCSRQTRAGHVCVALQAMADTPIVTEAGEPLVHDGTALRWPVLSAWIDSLRSS